ncbi:hypothetical protein NPIL_78481 [Nephila pilipes]|uniref:Uncharacterized protein n=1 Tax=Nephila pilipes TaxID=299642 RepID=A0A8X6Q3E6_NEPPI|nr:hypothetical protein NPIL_78481 [Nephila pilipes]
MVNTKPKLRDTNLSLTAYGNFKLKPEGYDEASHDAIMSKVHERARSLCIKFNPNKLQYKLVSVGLFALMFHLQLRQIMQAKSNLAPLNLLPDYSNTLNLEQWIDKGISPTIKGSIYVQCKLKNGWKFFPLSSSVFDQLLKKI